MKLTSRTLDQIHSPIGAAFALVPQRTNTRELLDLSQAAPTHPAAPVVIRRIAKAAAHPDGGRYAPQPGLPELREAFAAELSADYAGTVGAGNVLITAGCNQAFCLAVSTLAQRGDEIILPVPYYFNHDMWLRLDGLEVRHLETDATCIPDPERAEALITDRTRAITLVSPGNPTGVIIPPEVISSFAQLAARHDIALIVDETYRTFRGTDQPAHELFADTAWADHVISLHSFSKDMAIPGYRVGAVVAGEAVITEILKLLDCITICAPRIGQEAVLAGLSHAGEWRRDQQAHLATLQIRFEELMAQRPGGLELVTAGAYFGWVRHDGVSSTEDLHRRLVLDHDVLVIPGTAFTPDERNYLRFSFANLQDHHFATLAQRLNELGA